MKFLIIATRRQQMPFPPETLVHVLDAQREWIQSHVDEGRFDAIYGFPQGGGVAIAEARDGDELNRILMSSPAFMVNDWEIRPLSDIDATLSSAIDGIQRTMAAAPA